MRRTRNTSRPRWGPSRSIRQGEKHIDLRDLVKLVRFKTLLEVRLYPHYTTMNLAHWPLAVKQKPHYWGILRGSAIHANNGWASCPLWIEWNPHYIDIWPRTEPIFTAWRGAHWPLAIDSNSYRLSISAEPIPFARLEYMFTDRSRLRRNFIFLNPHGKPILSARDQRPSALIARDWVKPAQLCHIAEVWSNPSAQRLRPLIVCDLVKLAHPCNYAESHILSRDLCSSSRTSFNRVKLASASSFPEIQSNPHNLDRAHRSYGIEWN